MPNDDAIRRGSLTLEGQRVSYLCNDGSHAGPTLVFLHGSGVSARYWTGQLRALAGAARVLALDLPGHGESDDAAPPDLAHYADITAASIDTLGSWPAIVIGHSLGGAVALALAARRPTEVCGLVLISSCARLPHVSSSAQWLWGSLPAALRRALFFVTAKNMLFAAGASPAAVALGMQELRACRPRTLAADVAIARAMDLTAVAAGLRVPTLILCGSRDRVTPPILSRHLHTTIAGSRLEIVDGAGHMLLIEAPGIVSRAIAAFATSVSRQLVPAAGASVATDTSVFARWRRALQRLIAVVRRR
jgi:pimeloyl-ACP methyl ester carboxylesterase